MEAGNDEEDDDDADDAPIFTPELARLKAKESGKPIPAELEQDENMEDEEEDGDHGRDARKHRDSAR